MKKSPDLNTALIYHLYPHILRHFFTVVFAFISLTKGDFL